MTYITTIINTEYIQTFITDTNMMIPNSNINVEYIVQTFTIVKETFLFIVKEAIGSVNSNLSLIEKLLLCLCLYNVIVSFIHDIDKLQEQQKHKETITKLENDVKFLKKTIIIRDSNEHMWSEEIKKVRAEQANVIRDIEKELQLYKEQIITDDKHVIRLRPRKQK